MLAFTDTIETVSIPATEYEALTGLEASIRRMAAKRSPISRDHLSGMLERIRVTRL